MSSEAPKVLLIVPCFNESQRLRISTFRKELPAGVTVLFANDGSTDGTQALIESLCAGDGRFSSFQSKENLGKANIIHAAYSDARARDFLQNFEWIGFWDADLATPLSEIRNFLIYQREFAPQAQALFGSRINRFGAQVLRNPLRHYLSRVFVTLTDLFLGIRAYDSQCGAKLFSREKAEIALGKKFVSKWIFDLEIILRLNQKDIVEVPVQSWRDVAGSKVVLWRDSWRLLRDFWRIRKGGEG